MKRRIVRVERQASDYEDVLKPWTYLVRDKNAKLERKMSCKELEAKMCGKRVKYFFAMLVGDRLVFLDETHEQDW